MTDSIIHGRFSIDLFVRIHGANPDSYPTVVYIYYQFKEGPFKLAFTGLDWGHYTTELRLVSSFYLTTFSG